MRRTTQHDRDIFRRIVERSQLPIAIFTEWVLGRDRCTGDRYLHNGEIPQSTLQWLHHLQSVEQRGDEIHIVLRWGHPNPRWWPYVEHGAKRTFMTEERHVERNAQIPGIQNCRFCDRASHK